MLQRQVSSKLKLFKETNLVSWKQGAIMCTLCKDSKYQPKYRISNLLVNICQNTGLKTSSKSVHINQALVYAILGAAGQNLKSIIIKTLPWTWPTYLPTANTDQLMLHNILLAVKYFSTTNTRSHCTAMEGQQHQLKAPFMTTEIPHISVIWIKAAKGFHVHCVCQEYCQNRHLMKMVANPSCSMTWENRYHHSEKQSKAKAKQPYYWEHEYCHMYSGFTEFKH